MSGPVARMVHIVAVLVLAEASDLFADDANQRLGGDGLGDAAGELDAIDGQGVAGGNGGLVGNAQEGGARAAHLLLEQPGRGVGRFALEGVGADQFAEVGGLVGGSEARLAVDEGAHLVEVHLAAQARGGERGFRAGESAADDANLHWAGSVGFCRDSGQAVERVAADAHIAPLVKELGAHGAIEVDGRGIPVQDLPLQARAALFDGDGGNLLEQRLADAQAAELGLNEEVFEVEARAAHPGGVVEEVEGEAGRAGRRVRLSGRNRRGWGRIRRAADRLRWP